MAVSASELSITYAGVTIGGSSSRQITEWTRTEDDFVNGAFEFEFVTTAASDAAFASELSTIRTAFRTPRSNLVVTQNASTLLSISHSANTGLDTSPRILKDGDPADTGRSRHFRVRIEYELPADVTSTSFRRGTTLRVEYSESRRRTVTLIGIYTANSTDGTTTSDAQYLARVTAGDLETLLDQISSTATWELVTEPQFEWFETRKTTQFTRIYRELIQNQSSAGLDDTDIVDPELTITRERMAPGDSMEAGASFGAGGGGTDPFAGGPGTGVGSTAVVPAQTPIPSSAEVVQRPILVTITYKTSIDFSNTNLQAKWLNVIRPWLIIRAQSDQGNGGVVLIDEKPDFDYYENRISAVMQFVAYTSTIIKQKITHRDITSDGTILLPVTTGNRFEYYEYPGPAVRQRIIEEETEKIVVAGKTAATEISELYVSPGLVEVGLGENWVRISREPQVHVFLQGLEGAKTSRVAFIKITTVLQYRIKKTPSVANAGGVTGSVLSR